MSQMLTTPDTTKPRVRLAPSSVDSQQMKADPTLVAAPKVSLGRAMALDLVALASDACGAPPQTLGELRSLQLDPLRTHILETLGAVGALLHDCLNDRSLGVVAVDVAEPLDPDPRRDAMLAALTAVLVSAAFMKPARDTRNGTPFSIYHASTESEARLRAAGIKHFSPRDKLGFHTDGLRLLGEVRVPNIIALYNIKIAYRRPGNLYWIPMSLWPERRKILDRVGPDITYSMNMTPIVFGNPDGSLDVSSANRISAPIVRRISETGETIFFNGEIVGRADGGSFDAGVIDAMRASLIANPVRLTVAQKPRRLALMRNLSGFHARDIFEEPIVTHGVTRSFLRLVSEEGVQVA